MGGDSRCCQRALPRLFQRDVPLLAVWMLLPLCNLLEFELFPISGDEYLCVWASFCYSSSSWVYCCVGSLYDCTVPRLRSREKYFDMPRCQVEKFSYMSLIETITKNKPARYAAASPVIDLVRITHVFLWPDSSGSQKYLSSI